ncbi:MAG TPA: D-tyrosyl-tRNA(Tyr) deacylase [Firmicutes bacterium]|nr:D-tyrosyl-tRNA(Tyr) deacylase [Bacillota bacterium]
MRILIQEAKDAKVTVAGRVVGAIERGEVVLVSFTPGDSDATIQRMIKKMLNLRIFPDEAGNTNLNLAQYGGSILAVSQFTLYADLTRGNRPSFVASLPKEQAGVLFDHFKVELLKQLPTAQFGIFHADMLVSLTNVGPFTIWLDSKELGYE